jgi:hypothetical protein
MASEALFCFLLGRLPLHKEEEVTGVSLIPCTASCVYQHEGKCALVRAVSSGRPTGCGCVYFLPKGPSEEHRQSLPDVFHRDEL